MATSITDVPLPAGETPGIPGEGALAFLRDLAATPGDRSRYTTPYGEVYYFNHPDDARALLQSRNFVRPPLMKSLLGDGLLASEGPLWRAQRHTLQPAFRLPCVHALLPGIQAALADFVPRWEQAARSGQRVEVAGDMRRVTLDIILRCLFKVRFDEELDTMAAALTEMIRDLGLLTGTMLNQPHAVTPARNAIFRQSLATFDGLIQKIISQHPLVAQDGLPSILGLLQASTDLQSGGPLSDKLIRDEVASMILGGHETMGNVLSWIWEVLAEHPDIATRLHQELDALPSPGPLSHADLPRLPYTVMVFKEALRLFPPVWFMVRSPLEDCELRSMPLPAGASVMISPYTLHRHPSFWPDPETFDPDRFQPEAEATRHMGSWIPFAAGRHKCLGLPLAMMEGPLILATLARQFKIQPLPAGHPPLAATPLVTLRQRSGLASQVVSRTPDSQPTLPA